MSCSCHLEPVESCDPIESQALRETAYSFLSSLRRTLTRTRRLTEERQVALRGSFDSAHRIECHNMTTHFLPQGNVRGVVYAVSYIEVQETWLKLCINRFATQQKLYIEIRLFVSLSRNLRDPGIKTNFGDSKNSTHDRIRTTVTKHSNWYSTTYEEMGRKTTDLPDGNLICWNNITEKTFFCNFSRQL